MGIIKQANEVSVGDIVSNGSCLVCITNIDFNPLSFPSLGGVYCCDYKYVNVDDDGGKKFIALCGDTHIEIHNSLEDFSHDC